MCKYFIIETAAITSIENFQLIYNCFRPENFCFILDYPSKWTSHVLTFVDNDIQKQKIQNKLEKINKYIITHEAIKEIGSNNSSYSSFESYVTGRIVAEKSDIIPPHSIMLSEYWVDNRIFAPITNASFGRNLDEMKKLIFPFINRCNYIHIVDPYFFSKNKSGIIIEGPILLLQYILEQLLRRRKAYPRNIYYSMKLKYPNYTIQKEELLMELDKHNIRQYLDKQNGQKIIFFDQDFRDMHNRYIITDIGGLKFGKGVSYRTSDYGYAEYDDVSGISMEDIDTIRTHSSNKAYRDFEDDEPIAFSYPNN